MLEIVSQRLVDNETNYLVVFKDTTSNKQCSILIPKYTGDVSYTDFVWNFDEPVGLNLVTKGHYT
jgi:hypothetical protein